MLSYASQLPTEDPGESFFCEASHELILLVDSDDEDDEDIEEGGSVGMVPLRRQQQKGSRWSGHDTGKGTAFADEDDEHESLTEANQWKSIGAKSTGAANKSVSPINNSAADQGSSGSSQFDALPVAEGDDDEDYGLND